jgi:hypothetical protein
LNHPATPRVDITDDVATGPICLIEIYGDFAGLMDTA